MTISGSLEGFIGEERFKIDIGIHQRQSKYVHRILEARRQLHRKPVDTSLPFSANISEKYDVELEILPADHERYRSLTGTWSYLSVCRRPDTSFSISVLDEQLHVPTESGLALAKR